MTLNPQQFPDWEVDEKRGLSIGGKPIPAASANTYRSVSGVPVLYADVPLENGHRVSLYGEHSEGRSIYAMTVQHSRTTPGTAIGLGHPHAADPHARLQEWSNLPSPSEEIRNKNRQSLQHLSESLKGQEHLRFSNHLGDS